jgi:tetratricopeptide (TPR) repeat protein
MFTGHISSDTDRIASPAAMRFRRHSVFGVQRLRDLSPRARLLYRRNGIRLAIPGTMVEAIGGRGDMKRAIWLALGLAIGFAAQRWTRTSVADLELRATEAWNRKDLDAAEKLSRQALGRDPEARRAKEILGQLGQVLQRPEISFALASEARNRAGDPEGAVIETGRIALANHLFRLAEGAFQEGATRFPSNSAIRRQYVALSGLRLDAEEMQSRLLEWSRAGQPTADLVLMNIGLWSIETRGAGPSEEWLRAAVEADRTDIASRVGLARCLLAMGRYEECPPLLEGWESVPEARLLLAVAQATLRNMSAAEQLLPPEEPVRMRGEYWFTRGLIAMERNELPQAEAAFEKATQAQPLNKTYRSRYVDLIRRRDQSSERSRHVRELELVVRIVQQASQPKQIGGATSLGELARMCRDVGANDAATLLDKAVGP